MSAVDDYLAAAPEPQRSTLQTVRERLRVALPDAEETIAYGIPAFAVDGVSVAGFASAAKHCSYFPMSGTVLEGLGDAVAGFGRSRGTLRFAVDEPLSQDLIDTLVAARLREIAGD